MGRFRRRAGGGGAPSVPGRAEPRSPPHEAYLWDSGWHFGEWLEPGVDMEHIFGQLLAEDHGAVATAYLHRSASELAAIADLVGDNDAARRYGGLAADVLDAWR